MVDVFVCVLCCCVVLLHLFIVCVVCSFVSFTFLRFVLRCCFVFRHRLVLLSLFFMSRPKTHYFSRPHSSPFPFCVFSLLCFIVLLFCCRYFCFDDLLLFCLIFMLLSCSVVRLVTTSRVMRSACFITL